MPTSFYDEPDIEVLAMCHFVFHMLVVQQMHIGKDNLDRVIATCLSAAKNSLSF